MKHFLFLFFHIQLSLFIYVHISHMSVKHDHEHKRKEQHDFTTPTTPTTTQTRIGALPLDSVAHRRVGKDTHGTPRASTEEGRVWPTASSTRRPLTNDNMTKTSLESNVFSETTTVTHLDSYTVAEPVPETGDLRRDVVKLSERTRRQQS